MIRILTGGYHKEDYEFLQNLLRKSISDVQNNCIMHGNRCVQCEHHRACLDIIEVIEFLEKGGGR